GGRLARAQQPIDGEGARPDRPHATAVGGPETILLVEDEEKVRAIARSILEENGYEILEAGDAQAALAVADAHRAPIHLLLTDMILPKLDGVGLAARLAESRPDTKVLYMTGYAEDAATRRGPADPAIAILRKPFTSLDLLGMVRVALNERSNEAR
ncbi:MAG: response regulator, partial [Myxococcota bacterium]